MVKKSSRPRFRKKKADSGKMLSSFRLLGIFVFLVIFCLSAFLSYIFLSKGFLEQKRIVIAKYKEGSHHLLVYDLGEGEKSVITIPGNLYASAARQRGYWRLESVIKMITSEKLSGQMYADTFMKTFGIPVDFWVLGNKTNLSFFNKIYLYMLDFRSKFGRTEKYLLADAGALRYSQLPDGEMGYLFSGNLPADIKRLFVEELYLDKQYRVQVERHISKNFESTTDLVEVLNNMGLHVVNIKREEPFAELKCIIQTKNLKLTQRLSRIFDCETQEISQGNLDVILIIGDLFAQKF